ncbi:hypothetical protein CcaverHIS002_0211540 [Cutaneotrichosporon cavernicola]|nr:hypothetical protein CcaverHIS002_0211540 [Cutaneotrichosporon cavernicola]
MRGAYSLLLAVAGVAVATPLPTPPLFRPTHMITRNMTHMSPLISYSGDVDLIFAPPGTPDGTMADDITFSHHILQSGASAEFNFSGSAFILNGWADAMLRVREYPLGSSEVLRVREYPLGSEMSPRLSDEYELKTLGGVSERTLIAVLGDADDGPRTTDIPPSDEWGAPHWPIFEGWRGVREYMAAEAVGIWRETYVDFSNIGIEQPVAWGLGGYETDYASVRLSPAPGASYIELRGATPLETTGKGRFRVRVDPPIQGHDDGWHTVYPAGSTPADIVLFSSALDSTLAYSVTLEVQGVGWHWASAWFLAEMGVQPMPKWIGHWGRVRRVLDSVRARMAIVLASVVAVAAVVLGFVLARRRVQKDDGERQPLLAETEDDA